MPGVVDVATHTKPPSDVRRIIKPATSPASVLLLGARVIWGVESQYRWSPQHYLPAAREGVPLTIGPEIK